MHPRKQPRFIPAAVPAIAILAGGLSRRMGRDKSMLELHNIPLLEWVRRIARKSARTVHVIRRDRIPGCGPLGGILTAFRRSTVNSILFLACDMPFLAPDYLNRIHRLSQSSRRPVFTRIGCRAGFPFVLRRPDLAVVNHQIRSGQKSLQALATVLQAKWLIPKRVELDAFANINTPQDWACLNAGGRWFAAE